MNRNCWIPIARAITPPFIWEQLRKVRKKQEDEYAIDCEAGCSPSWYDAVFSTSENYNVHYSRSGYYFLWCVLVDRVVRHGSQSVLDIGCGPGQVAAFLRDKGLRRYTGIDWSEVAINRARALCPNGQFFAVNALQSDVFETVEYDTAISLEFLEHVQEDISVLERLLPGTRFLGTVPNFDYLSHVRFFSSCDEVAKQYSPLFRNFTVDAFQAPDDDHVFYLFEGIKR